MLVNKFLPLYWPAVGEKDFLSDFLALPSTVDGLTEQSLATANASLMKDSQCLMNTTFNGIFQLGTTE